MSKNSTQKKLGNVNYVNHELLKKDTLVKRKYQIRIFLTCTQNNCLVVIPTGLGKTIVALLLALQRLKKPKSKIIFLAPTRPLVEQHLNTFKNLTVMEEDELLMLTGSVSPDKREKLYKKDIKCMFSTPQVLQNDIIANRIDLTNISLMVFDEAHRATGNYSYNFLAKKYTENAKDPKVLALTASPGKNKEKILEVMENLYLNEVEIRTEKDLDVRPYLHEVKTIWKDVELPEEMEECIDLFEDLKRTLYRELKEHEFLESASVSSVTRRDLLSGGKRLDAEIARSQGTSRFPLLLYLKKVISNAIRVSHMHELLETQGLQSLKKYLDKNIKKVEENKGGKSLRELFNSPKLQEIIQNVNDLIEGQINHPKVSVLMDLLKGQFEKNNESRILVFCQFRDTIRTILEAINKHELIEAKKFIGQQRRGNNKGLTQNQQIELLEEFKSGEINTLVATSVAEEGLDIAECDMVIFYDVVPSAIRSIQRRGRTGRSKAGKVIILKTKGTREEGYFWAERHREKEMKRVLKELKNEISNRNKGMENGNNSQQKSLSSFVKKNGQKGSETEENESSKERQPGLQSSDLPKTNNKENPKANNKKKEKVKNKEKEKIEKDKYSDKENRNKSESEELPLSKDDVEALTKEEISKAFPLENRNSSRSTYKGYYVIADSRETASPVTRILSELNAKIKIQKIPIGDYIVSPRCGIERKSLQDFTDSIKDGRLFRELKKLKGQFSYPLLIIEGDINSIVAINRAAVMGTITTIMLKFNVNLYQTQNANETAEFILALAKKEQKKDKKTFSIRFKKVPEKLKEKLEYIVAGIPGINVSRARDLLYEFDTIQNLFNASEEELQDVHNIGPKIAQKIKKYAESHYRL